MQAKLPDLERVLDEALVSCGGKVKRPVAAAVPRGEGEHQSCLGRRDSHCLVNPMDVLHHNGAVGVASATRGDRDSQGPCAVIGDDS
jgi:hypothetical protein